MIKWLPPISLLLWTLDTLPCSHLLPDCFHTSYMDYFYQTLAQVGIWALAQVGILALSDNQDGHQNVRHLSVCTYGHSYLTFITRFLQKFHIWTTFIKLLVMSAYGFCPMNKNQVCRQNRHPFFLPGIMSFVGVQLF